MRYPSTPDEEATFLALWQGILLVIVPGLLFVLGLIWLATPPYKPPPRDWANGTYVNACCVPLVLRDGKATAGSQATDYVLQDGKTRVEIAVPRGIGVRQGRVEFDDSHIAASFLGPRVATRGKPEALKLFGADDHLEYVFVRRQ